MSTDNPDRVGPSDRPGAPKPVAPGEEKQSPTQSFESYMNDKTPGATPGEQTSGVSPYDLAAQGKTIPGTAPSPEAINAQIRSTSGQLGDLQNQLNTKNLKLKQSQKYLLRNKFKQANDLIRTAATKSGAQVTDPPSMLSRQNPIQKYIAMVNDSQKNLENAQKHLQELNSSGKSLEPGHLLLIQVKLAKAQQELEYSSVLLSKAIDDIKMLFNIQL